MTEDISFGMWKICEAPERTLTKCAIRDQLKWFVRGKEIGAKGVEKKAKIATCDRDFYLTWCSTFTNSPSVSRRHRPRPGRLQGRSADLIALDTAGENCGGLAVKPILH